MKQPHSFSFPVIGYFSFSEKAGHQSRYSRIKTGVQSWRRWRDLNPRAGFIQPTPLAGEPLRPLGYFRRSMVFFQLAERVGFEPTDAFTSPVFKTGAFDHSAISPYVKANLCQKQIRFYHPRSRLSTQNARSLRINISRRGRGYFLCGQSPMLPATPHAALVRSDICMGLVTCRP